MIDVSVLMESLPALIYGALQSIQIALFSTVIGIVLGGILGLTQIYGNRFGQVVVTIYVTLIRGTPMLIQLFFVFYALPQLGVHLSPFQAAVLAIGLNSSAYVSQIVRSGLQSIPEGQLESARLLKIPFYKQLRFIILPQALNICWPAIGNELVTLIKDSSLASMVGVMELTKQGSIIRSRTYDAFTVLVGVALLYLVMTISLQVLWNMWEKKRKACCT